MAENYINIKVAGLVYPLSPSQPPCFFRQIQITRTANKCATALLWATKRRTGVGHWTPGARVLQWVKLNAWPIVRRVGINRVIEHKPYPCC